MKRKHPGGSNIKKIGKKTRFKKGKSGNPDGRPPGPTITRYLLNRSNDPIDIAIKNSKGQTIRVESIERADAVAMRVWDLAMKGDPRIAWRYIEILQDRMEGKATLPIEINGLEKQYDLSKLNSQELKELEKVHKKLMSHD